MRTKFFFFTLACVTIFPVILVMLALNPTTLGAVTQKEPSAEAGGALVEGVDAQLDAGDPSAAQPDASQVEPSLDGAALLRSRCSKCHLAVLLERTKKTRLEWEDALAKMERNGVGLEEAEKAVLLDYLAGAE